MTSKAIVIGSGIAGIAASVRLRALGYEVEVFEAYHKPGGKLQEFLLEGYRFDAGPSLFTLPHLVDELFELGGEDPKDHFHYLKKNQVCHYFWENGKRFQAPADIEAFASSAAKTFNEPKRNILKYISKNSAKYHLTAPLFIEKSLHRLSTFFNRQALKAVLQLRQLNIFSNLHQLNKRHFKSKELVQLFDRYATYNGSSPYQTSGIMSMIPHLEMDIGTFFPLGGMYRITESLCGLAERMGVQFHFSSPVERILVNQGKADGIVLASGEKREADLIVSNMDVFSTYHRLLTDQPKPKRILNQERSCSAIIFYWGVRKEFEELDLHNIIFSEDYRGEFEHIFKKKDLHPDPTVYINITSKHNASDAPAGCENWFVLINAPYNDGQDWNELVDRCRNNVIKKVNRVLGVDLASLIEVEVVLDPREIESRTSSYKGALYGTSSNSMFSAFWRHPNFKRSISNLYFCGGSVHPGGGIPLCLNSAKIVGNMVAEARGEHFSSAITH